MHKPYFGLIACWLRLSTDDRRTTKGRTTAVTTQQQLVYTIYSHDKVTVFWECRFRFTAAPYAKPSKCFLYSTIFHSTRRIMGINVFTYSRLQIVWDPLECVLQCYPLVGILRISVFFLEFRRNVLLTFFNRLRPERVD